MSVQVVAAGRLPNPSVELKTTLRTWIGRIALLAVKNVKKFDELIRPQ